MLPKRRPLIPAGAGATIRSLVFLSGLLIFLIAGCTLSDRGSYEDTEWEEEDAPTSESWDVSYSISEADASTGSSHPRLLMKAGYMASYDRDSSYVLLKGAEDGDDEQVRAVIFDTERRDTSAVVHARRIIYREDTRTFFASGEVFVEARGERRMWSERMEWDEQSKEIRAPGFVRIETPRERIEGYNLEADEDLDNYRLERVTGEAEIEEDESGGTEPPQE